MTPDQAELAMTWGNMIARCYDPASQKFHHYGGRGIRVADRWHTFFSFVDDMGVRPCGFSLDRIDVNGDYSPENCRWADDKTQARNKRNTRLLTIDGRTMCEMDWATESGTGRATIRHRIKHGWNPKDAVYGKPFSKRARKLTHDGKDLTVVEWSEKTGISKAVIKQRLQNGWSVERTLTQSLEIHKKPEIDHGTR